MTILIAAFNLPVSIEIGVDDPVEKPQDDENDTRRVPLIRPPPSQAPELIPDRPDKLHVPFDFASAPKKSSEPSVPQEALQKSIVDTRKPVSSKESVTVNTVLSDRRKSRGVPELEEKKKEDSKPNPDNIRHSRARSISSRTARRGSEHSLPDLTRTTSVRARRLTISGRPRSDSESLTTQPFSVIHQPSGNGGLYNAISRSVEAGIIENPEWFGLLGVPTDAIGEPLKTRVTAKMKQRNCNVVYVPDSQYVGHYHYYCKEFLWPTFHAQIPDIPKARTYEEHSWGDYTAVNQAVADAIIERYQEGDTIWVHDYHLMLVPAMIRKRHPQASIGFFMHIAFPTSEVFRCLAYRADILRGLLGANCVGFQNKEYAGHFLMTASRILALDTVDAYIQTPDRNVKVIACPIGIDPIRLDTIANSEEVIQHREIIRARWPNVKIIGARDKVDNIKGLRHKLQAFSMFLSSHPEMATKVVLIQVLLSNAGNSEIEAELATLAEHINSTYGDLAAGVQPVVLLRQDIIFNQYIALISEADAFVVTSLREGMNLTCHEFIYCNDVKRMGPVILSEFTGSASVLGDDAVLVNPWDKKRLAEAFYEAVTMPENERTRRHNNVKQIVRDNTCQAWVSEMFEELTDVWMQDQARLSRKPDIESIKEAYKTVDEDKRFFFIGIPSGLAQSPSFLLDQVRAQTTIESPSPRSHHSPSSSPPAKAKPSRPPMRTFGPSYYSSRLNFVLQGLSSDPLNIVYVASEESKAYMERVFRQLPWIGLVAESGKYLRLAGRDDWLELQPDLNVEWQKEMKPMLENLRERLPVREMRVHESTIVIDFEYEDDVSQERGLATIGEFISVIDDTFSKHGVRSRFEGTQLIIFTSQLMNMQARMQQAIFEYHKGTLGLALVALHPLASDTDEIAYTYLDLLKAAGRIKTLVSIALGQHVTLAQSNLEGINSLLTLIETISA